MRIGIFGGTFNPPHLGHIRLANAAVDKLGLDMLFVIPSGVPPHKSMPKGSPTADMRLTMAREAFNKTSNAVVSDVETMIHEKSYTIDTVTSIKQEYPGAEMVLLVGADMYLTLESWKDSANLLKNTIPAVFAREDDDFGKIEEYSLVLNKKYGVHTEIVANNVTEISSSRLRKLLPERKGAEFIADVNYTYIIKNSLYNAKADWGWLRRNAYSMLSPTRIPHVAGCEEEAVRLAGRWGVDIDDAREAAILHDVTKRLDADGHMKLLKKYGYNEAKPTLDEEKLLHSKTGAIVARSEFGASETVADAIMWHTTGRAGMNALEKVIYLADYIEPTRIIDGIDALRALSYEDIDKAMKMGLQMSIADMEARGIMPNHMTFDALNSLCE